MDAVEKDFAESLLHIFDNVLLTEEMALSKGYFSDLSIAELHTLNAIGPYEARTMTETANILGITIGTLTVAVDRLVKKEYVTRSYSPTDRRVIYVELTPAGEAANRKYLDFIRDMIRTVGRDLDEENADAMIVSILSLTDYLESKAASE